MPYFFAQRTGERVLIEGDDARHLAASLRARVGEEIEVVDPSGLLLTVKLDEVSVRRVAGSVLAERPYDPESAAHVSIAVANLPASALELVISRCTEAGASSLHVFQAERSVARGAKLERWTAIAREATMLAGRLRVPDVTHAPSMESVLDHLTNPVLLVRGASIPLARLEAPADISLLVGPEGGWTERELTLVSRHASLGPRNLRADTAAVVGLAIALSRREA